jgi:hypothetical protein
MSSNYFLNKENISMIWDVITDENIFKFLSRDIQQKVASVFTNNLKGFFESEIKNTNNLIDLNKKYIMLILNHIKTNYPQQQPNKIKILEEISSEQKQLITYEELQNDRKSQFDKDLNKRQEEFSNAMSLPIPEVPEFVDKNVDKPITEMEKLIKEITAQRNYEVEQINRNYEKSENWLNSQETSIKSEKKLLSNQNLQQINNNNNNNNNNSNNNNNNNINNNNNNNNINNNKLKYIKITNDQIELESPDKRKNVSWGPDSEISENINDVFEENIFKKLKILNKPSITLNIEEYENVKSDNERVSILENEIKLIHSKMDMILNIIKQNK